MLTTTLMYNKDMSCNFFCLIIYSLRRISKFLKSVKVSEKERKKKKSKTREICCDEVFVICPHQNSETPSVPCNSPKIVSPLKKWSPSNFDHFLDECLNCTIYYCFSKLPKFKSTTFFFFRYYYALSKKNT